MIKFSHTVFALPFAFTGAVLAAGGIPSPRQLVWITVAMAGARTCAMSLNRLIDAEIDSKNPRTKGRALPSGLLSRNAVAGWSVLSASVMIFAAAQLNLLCLYLAPVALFFLVLYSYCKRFTSSAHLVLGLCLAAAPAGAWIAVTGSFGLPPLLLSLAVLFWVAGFDVLYALQDLEFDRSAGLHSIPVRFGVSGSLRIARIFHLVMVGLLIGLWRSLDLGLWFAAGVAVAGAMLVYEHLLLRKGDLSKLDAAFFNMNGYISVALFLFTVADVFTSGRSVIV
jgi:4-hydroxybenzoate polyprenyltransferase